MRSPFSLVLLHAGGVAAGFFLARLDLPLTWMLGAILVSAAANLLFSLDEPPRCLRLVGQLVVGCAIGMYLTPDSLQSVLDRIALIVLSAVLIVAAACLIGIGEARLCGTNRATAFFSCIPGGPVEMANMAQHHGGDPGRTGLAQSLRVVTVVLLFPPLLMLQGASVSAIVPAVEAVSVPGLAVALAAALVSSFLAQRLKLLNPFFLGPMIGIGVITASGTQLSGMPPWLTSAAQVLLGVSLGAMMRRELFRSVGRFAFVILATTAALFLACIGIAELLSGAFSADLHTMLLANAPGGVTEMVLTASAANLDVPLVAAFHVVRIFLVMSAIPLVYRVASRL